MALVVPALELQVLRLLLQGRLDVLGGKLPGAELLSSQLSATEVSNAVIQVYVKCSCFWHARYAKSSSGF